MSFSENKDLLNDTNIMSEDTGETCYSTKWYKGMINMKIDGKEDIITAASGE